MPFGDWFLNADTLNVDALRLYIVQGYIKGLIELRKILKMTTMSAKGIEDIYYGTFMESEPNHGLIYMKHQFHHLVIIAQPFIRR